MCMLVAAITDSNHNYIITYKILKIIVTIKIISFSPCDVRLKIICVCIWQIFYVNVLM